MSESVKVDPRTLFAAERTLLAWIRTGLALMGFGFALARFGLFLRETAAASGATPSHHYSGPLGLALVAVGIAANIAAIYEHRKTIHRLRRGETMFDPEISRATYIAWAMALIGVATCAYLLTIQ
jgi:putative membrane protein